MCRYYLCNSATYHVLPMKISLISKRIFASYYSSVKRKSSFVKQANLG